MDTASIRPSTVDGIKQLAKKIGRERNITHTEALEAASRQAGYENFVHAKRQLIGPDGPRGFPVYLSVHWRAPREREGKRTHDGPVAGREILRLDLARPLPAIVAKHRVSHGRGLHGFRMEYEDHLEHLTNAQGVEKAREVLLTAARSLRFMEATNLQPVSSQRYRDILRPIEKMPGRDHYSQWFDPNTERCIFLDEPYAEALKTLEADRRRWADRHGMHMVEPEWEGIYYPRACLPRLVGPDLLELKRVADALAKTQPVTEPETWPHETGVCGDDFVSPKRQADSKPRRPRPGPSWREHKGATPYGGAAGIRSNWRPTKPMPFELHQQLGPLMQKLCAGFTWRVSQKLGLARSMLEEWSIEEHKYKHPDAAYNLYYGGPSLPLCNTDTERLGALAEARRILERGYDDCRPRRNVLAALDAAIDEMNKQLHA